jgi:rSAM/selenodomain-associated transferase 1
MSRDHHLVVMAKQPVLGQVKTRLARQVGAMEATRTYRLMLGSLLRRLAGDPRWQVWVATAGVHQVHAPVWPARVNVVDQGTGGLGQRMQYLFDTMPRGPVVIIGADIPAIGRMDIAAAFRTLGSRDYCFGPAFDGGFWLVGQSRSCRGRTVFAPDVRWSSEHALADCLHALVGHRVGLLRMLADVDDAASYRDFISPAQASS